MDVALTVGVIATVVVIYIIYSNFFASRGASTLSSMQPGTAQQTVSAGKVAGANSSNYAFSVWMFVEDWGYSYGKKKMVLARGSGDLEMYLAPELNNFVFSTALTGGPAVDLAASGSGTPGVALGCYKDRAQRAMSKQFSGAMTKAQCETAVKGAGKKDMGPQDATAAGVAHRIGSTDMA